MEECKKEILSSSNDLGAIREIVSYLNQKADTAFRTLTQKTRQHIRARFSEGFTVEDFKAVIACKADEWLNDAKMSRFLRPKTLFSSENFEAYLNEAKKTEMRGEMRIGPDY